MKKVTLITAALCFVMLALGTTADAAPSFKPSLYGYIKLDGAYDQNMTSHGNFVMWVNPRSNGTDDEQFNMTHKQSRFGVKINGEGYDNLNIGAQAEVDLYASGGTENKALFLIRHAYLWLGTGNFKVIAGQYWDMVSPLNPSTLNYSVLWGCGNIGYRRPQVSFWYTYQAANSYKVTFAAGAYRNMGDDLISLTLSTAGESADGEDDGTDAGIPSAQGYADFQYNWDKNGYVRFGGSGAYGQLKSETDAGNEEKYDSWLASGHFKVSFPQGFGFSGEVYTGVNTRQYNGGIAQSSTISGVDSKGGWFSAWAKVAPQFKLGAGVGLDDPDDADIANNSRAKNTSYYGNIQYNVVPGAMIGLEVSQWETEYKAAETAKNLRVQTSFMLSF